MSQEDVARVANDLGLTPEFVCFLGRNVALEASLSAYKKAASREMSPNLQDSDDNIEACEARLKRFNLRIL